MVPLLLSILPPGPLAVFRASLLVINGANRGTRYDIASDQDTVIGRSVGCTLRLDDSEVSRQHARISHTGDEFVLHDLGSANGTRVNGHVLTQRVLCNGDNLQFGSTVLLYQLAENEQPLVASADQVRFIDDSRSVNESAIVQSVGVDEPTAPVAEAEQKYGLELLYHVAEELVTPVRSLDEVLQRILNLALQAIDADRGCVLLKDPVGVDLTAIAFARRGVTQSGSLQMPVSRSITDYVLRHGVAVRTSDAKIDDRFIPGRVLSHPESAKQSVLRCEAGPICWGCCIWTRQHRLIRQ
jgi:two-component system NtrC family sensor kinase